MLDSTRLVLAEISNIGFNMANQPTSFDPVQQFKRIQRMAETALEDERRHEKEMLARLNASEAAS